MHFPAVTVKDMLWLDTDVSPVFFSFLPFLSIFLSFDPIKSVCHISAKNLYDQFCFPIVKVIKIHILFVVYVGL
jgi:hypothetical protein